MKRTILGLAFLTIASLSFGAAAQSSKDKSDCKSKTECVAKKCTKGEKGAKAKGEGKAKKAEMKAARQAALFEGVNLTAEQKGRIEALDGAVKISRQELKEQAKTARQNGDTAFNMRAKSKELRGKYIKDLGEILTPDQMITYLENFYVNTGNQKGMKKSVAMHSGNIKPGKMMKHKGEGKVKHMKGKVGKSQPK